MSRRTTTPMVRTKWGERERKDVKLTLMMSKEDRAMLETLALDSDLSASHVVRRLIRQEADRTGGGGKSR